MKTLTQLTFLVNLHKIWDESYESESMDKSTALLIAHNLQHFPQLESFTLIAYVTYMIGLTMIKKK